MFLTKWRPVAIAIGLLVGSAAPLRAEPIVGLTTTNGLVLFDSAAPGGIIRAVAVTGLPVGATLQGIDVRPIDGALVGMATLQGGGAGIFQLNPFTGAATPINTVPTLTGTAFGFDFNPVPNALRIVTNTDQNFRLTAGGTGTVNTDSAINPANGGLTGAAYTNNIPGGVGGQTTLYVIDGITGTLLTQGSVNFPPGTSPNTGTLFNVGPLGLGTNLGGNVGFDISPGGAAYISVGNALYGVNVATGQTTQLGTIGNGAIRDIAVAPGAFIPEPGTLALFAAAGVGLVGATRRNRRGA